MSYLSPHDDSYEDQPRDAERSALPWILLVLLLIPVIACAAFTVVTVGGINQAVDVVRDLLQGGELVVYTDQSPAVLTRVQDLGRLETVNYTIEKVIEGNVEQGPELLDFLLGDRILLVAHGEVIGGIDLTQMTDDDIMVSEAGARVRVRLPGAIILTHRLDNEKSRVYDRQTGLLTKGDPNLESEVRRAAEQQILRAACEAGILAQATENAQRQLTLMLQSMGHANVDFVPGEVTGPTGCE